MKTNALYYGDNLVWLQDKTHFPDESVDLIYLDPPFNSNADYNIIFNEKEGDKSQAQLKAFDDTWKWEKESAHKALLELTVSSPSISEFIRWLSRRSDTKSTGTAAYLSMMAIRLMELYRVLKPTGSLYLHCDPTASHYLKMIMDVIFGAKNFRNEIVWCYSGGGIPTQDFPRKHDVIFRYTKGKQWTYHHEYHPYNELTAQRMQYIHKGVMVDTERGTPVTDWWPDLKRPTGPRNKERLGYPTQKPEALLERIIKASSNEGDVLLDPFCGCGTSISVASKLNRQWIGIDVTYLAIDLIEKRLMDNFGVDIKQTYKVHGNPFDTASAQALFDKDNMDKHAFELWALSLVDARSRIKDKGVDGIIGFIDDTGEPRRIVVQVKGGANLTPTIIRDLDGTVKNESAAMGLLISLHTPTKGIYEYANHAGDYISTQRDKPFQMLQIRTVDELLHNNTFDLPMWKKATK